MRGYLLITVLSISLSLTACKAKKMVTTGHTETSAATASTTAGASRVGEKLTLIEGLLSTINSDVDITQTVTLFSAPDSLGNQHRLQVTETKATAKTRNTQHATQNTQLETVKVDTTSTLTLASASSLTDTTQTETPRGQGWKTWTAIILSLGAVLLAYLLLRRFGLVKVKGGALGSIFKNN